MAQGTMEQQQQEVDTKQDDDNKKKEQATPPTLPNLAPTSTEVEERIKLVNNIKELDHDKLTKLGFMMTSSEYRALDNEYQIDENGEQMKTDAKNGTSIELDVNKLSLIKIRYIQTYIN